MYLVTLPYRRCRIRCQKRTLFIWQRGGAMWQRRPTTLSASMGGFATVREGQQFLSSELIFARTLAKRFRSSAALARQ